MKEKLHDLVVGCLVEVIRVHGSITMDLVNSATKRIVGTLLGQCAPEELIQATVEQLKERYDRENQKLKNRNVRLERRLNHERRSTSSDRDAS